MAESKRTSPNMDSTAHEEAGNEDNRGERRTEEKGSEAQNDRESTETTLEESKVSQKETVSEEKSPEPKSSSTSSGIESRGELETPPEVAGTEAAKTSASSSEPPSVSGAEGSSTSGIEGSSAVETRNPPLDEHGEVSPTKKSKASSFTGAIRKIISPRKKDGSHEDEVTSPKDKQKSKSFLRNPLRASKTTSPPIKSPDVSSMPAGKEAPDVIPPMFSPPKAAKGSKAVSPSVTSPTKKDGKKGITKRIKKSLSSIFKKTDSTEGLYMPEDAEVAAAEAAEAAASRAAQPREEERVTPPPFPGKPGFPYWRQERLSLDENIPSLCETSNTDEQSECSKFSDAFVPDLDASRQSEFEVELSADRVTAAIALVALKTAAIALEATGGAGEQLPASGDDESSASVDASMADDETSPDKADEPDAAAPEDPSDNPDPAVPETLPDVADQDKSDATEKPDFPET